MTIRTSSARDVDALLQQLRSSSALDRDAAIARLRILGARARDRVLALLTDTTAPTDVRIAALKIIDALDDPATKRVVIATSADADPAVAITALQVLRPWLATDADVSALERVTSLVTDVSAPLAVRRAALDALSELPLSLTQPLVQSVAAQLASMPPLDDPATAREWLANHEQASLGVLHDLLGQARDRQHGATSDAERSAWFVVRATTHAVLARRGSRIALYDARELFEHAQAPLPFDLLVAMRTIGDLTCLEALARAWETVADDEWWRGQVRETAVAIVTREKATSRNASVKRVKTRWPGFLS